MHHLDFNAVPRRSFFVLLRQFATDEMDQEKLDEFTSAEGAVCHPVHLSVRGVTSFPLRTINLLPLPIATPAARSDLMADYAFPGRAIRLLPETTPNYP